MSDSINRTVRRVHARRIIGGLAAVAVSGTVSAASVDDMSETPLEPTMLLAQAEGEGEGEGASVAGGEGEGGEGEGEGEGGASLDPATAFLSGLGFMEGHIRAGVALYEAGDLEAAKTHMGHPIKEKYGAVAGQLEELGMSDVREDLTALADAAEAEADYETVSALFAQVYARFEEARTNYTTAEQAAGLVALTRVAGEEYTVAVAGDGISNLHEYQDSWGFIRAVETEAIQMAASNNETVAEVGAAIREQVNAMDAVYGDLQGQGDFEMTPSTIYSAAARMEIAALDLDSNGAN